MTIDGKIDIQASINASQTIQEASKHIPLQRRQQVLTQPLVVRINPELQKQNLLQLLWQNSAKQVMSFTRSLSLELLKKFPMQS
jgi:hypothetical protein